MPSRFERMRSSGALARESRSDAANRLPMPEDRPPLACVVACEERAGLFQRTVSSLKPGPSSCIDFVTQWWGLALIANLSPGGPPSSGAFFVGWKSNLEIKGDPEWPMSETQISAALDGRNEPRGRGHFLRNPSRISALMLRRPLRRGSAARQTPWPRRGPFAEAFFEMKSPRV
jgi:hypothetical protein